MKSVEILFDDSRVHNVAQEVIRVEIVAWVVIHEVIVQREQVVVLCVVQAHHKQIHEQQVVTFVHHEEYQWPVRVNVCHVVYEPIEVEMNVLVVELVHFEIRREWQAVQHVQGELINDEHEELFVYHVVLEVIVVPEQVVAFHVYQERSKQAHKQQVVKHVQ